MSDRSLFTAVATALALLPLVGVQPSEALGERVDPLALQSARHANEIGLSTRRTESQGARSAKTVPDPMRTWSLGRLDLARILPNGSHIRDCLTGFCTLTEDEHDFAGRAPLDAGFAAPGKIEFDLVRVRNDMLEDERICLHDGIGPRDAKGSEPALFDEAPEIASDLAAWIDFDGERVRPDELRKKPVPEPSTGLLMGAGLAFASARRARSPAPLR